MEEGIKLLNRRKLLKRYAAGERDFAGIRISSSGLDGEDLRCINLSGADLTGINFSGANLSHANLIGAKMLCVNLTNANLSYANLRGADLSGADCIETDFSNASLNNAILTAALFEGANLYQAAIGGNARLIGTDFRGAKNFPPLGEGVLVCKTFWEDGSFFKGPDWIE
ncbi:pentapeptide repeat protein [Calothrix sp. NIES-4071]|nr:pentapeptide repeat protein [Calothrix sp. NIES-4071]BAZ63902.1 pentapeptide repeat protein [Calothrix sp. NIES-4105]